MLLSNENYEIQIIKDRQYSLFSTDNKHYKDVFLMEKYSRNNFTCAYCVSINNLINDYMIAIIGRAYGSIENCAILEDSRLIILIDDYLVFLNLSTLNLEAKIKILNFGTGIEIYQFDDGYIVNGEIEIIKVNKFGSKIWSFSGRDIWVRTNAESSVSILEDSILLTDFEGYS